MITERLLIVILRRGGESTQRRRTGTRKLYSYHPAIHPILNLRPYVRLSPFFLPHCITYLPSSPYVSPGLCPIFTPLYLLPTLALFLTLTVSHFVLFCIRFPNIPSLSLPLFMSLSLSISISILYSLDLSSFCPPLSQPFPCTRQGFV